MIQPLLRHQVKKADVFLPKEEKASGNVGGMCMKKKEDGYLRCRVQADAVSLRGRRRLVIGGEDGQAGRSVDHMIHQVTDR